MKKIPGRTTTLYTNALSAARLACLPAVLLLASCNAPAPPPAAAAPPVVVDRPVVIDRRPVIEPPSINVVISPDEQKRRDEDQRHRDEDQREHAH